MGSATLHPGTVVAGRYRVTGVLGEGGMGVVYLVQHVHTDEELAMKVLHAQVLRDDDAVQRFRREARAPARVNSEHVARVTDADTAPELGGAPFYVMEYLRGKDLDVILRETGPLPAGEAVECLRQAARALDKAHQMGIVHRDLKPENLFLTMREDGTPCIKLLDFGIAKVVAGAMPANVKTQSGAVFGTPAYMSPEQARGDADLIGPPADIWAIGLIAFKLLTGRDYWTADVVAQLYVEILASPMPPPSERAVGVALGPAFDAWFAACVNRDVAARYPSVGEAVTALAAALGVEPGSRRSLASIAHAPTVVDSQQRAVVHVTGGAPPAITSPPTATTHGGQGQKRSPVGMILGLGALVVAGTIGTGLFVMKGGSKAVAHAAPTATARVETAPHAGPSAVLPVAPLPSTPEPIVAPATPGPAAEASAPAPSTEAARPPGPAPTGRRSSGPAPVKTSAAEAPPAPHPAAEDPPAAPPRTPSRREMSGDQLRRLDALKRMCDSGLLSSAECAQKRAAIMTGN